MNTTRTHGYAMITALVTLTIVGLITALMISSTVSEMQQVGNSQAVARTRSAAEAGQADASFYLVGAGLTDVNAVLQTYVNRFATSNGNAADEDIVTRNDYPAVSAALNARPGMSMTGQVGGVSYTARITFGEAIVTDARTNVNQTYYLPYTVTSTGRDGQYTRTVTSQGQLKVVLGRTYLNQYVLLADDGGSQQGNFYATGMSYDGPVHINRNWRFAGRPQFLMGATTAAATVQMYRCTQPAKYVDVSV
ncbi:DUF4900 domain-containing protein [Deinococcus pimensis]|uniref:DUF4900 domain-containing protein n=1 Tax=Deinococcus pimensis TaxID=309888 RepID=UPI0004889F2D|nr:DUF4900 domain-containing protein [Deinococcus pimensis]